MNHPIIEADNCYGCGSCVEACENGVLEVVDGIVEVTDEDSCVGCGDCVDECPMGAIVDIAED